MTDSGGSYYGWKANYLSFLAIGKKAKVKFLTLDGSIRRRMLDLGLVSDTIVEALQKSPSGDPTAYHIRGAVIALRSEEASKIMVEIN
ncbi:FeoA family protein [Acetivibrio straminisolvens]|uniref:FeoA family protein n=1 Tax=Acetivibrio straminisolvens TaxID=253314 RepID=UPI0006D1CECF|nr:FeoA family protein [Acetivibrio straminisolvens]